MWAMTKMLTSASCHERLLPGSVFEECHVPGDNNQRNDDEEGPSVGHVFFGAFIFVFLLWHVVDLQFILPQKGHERNCLHGHRPKVQGQVCPPGRCAAGSL